MSTTEATGQPVARLVLDSAVFRGVVGVFRRRGLTHGSLEECMVVATLNVVPLWTLRDDPGVVSHVMIKQTTCGGAIVRRVCI